MAFPLLTDHEGYFPANIGDNTSYFPRSCPLFPPEKCPGGFCRKKLNCQGFWPCSKKFS